MFDFTEEQRKHVEKVEMLIRNRRRVYPRYETRDIVNQANDLELAGNLTAADMLRSLVNERPERK